MMMLEDLGFSGRISYDRRPLLVVDSRRVEHSNTGNKMDVCTRERGGFDPGPRGACLHVVGEFGSCWQYAIGIGSSWLGSTGLISIETAIHPAIRLPMKLLGACAKRPSYTAATG